MTSPSISVAAVAAAPLSVASSSVTKAGAIASAAHHLLLHLERGQRIDAPAFIGMVLIVAGVVVMNVFSKAVAH